MPRNGSGVYSVPAGSAATTNTTIQSAPYNALLTDLESDLNAARPVTAGGTGGTSVITGWDGLAKKGTDIATASTINLTTATGPSLSLTGTTTVTAVTLAEGSFRLVRAAAAFTITASSTLLCNGSSSTNMSVSAEDLLVFRGGASSVVTVSRIGASSTVDATTSTKGIVKLATVAHALAGTETDTAVTPAGLYLPTGHLFGLTLSNGTDATNDIDIAAGTCRDSSDTQNLICTAMTKQLDASWAAGTAAGMRYSGASIANGTYHIYAVGKALGADQDYYADPSASASTVLGHLQAETGGSDYLYVRRIGSILRESAAIVAFSQNGDRFAINTPAQDVSAASGTTAQTQSVRVPDGIQVGVFGAFSTSGNATIYPSALTQADMAASASSAPGGIFIGTSVQAFGPIMTNTSKQIRTRSNAGVTLGIYTWGWLDSRGM